MRWSRGVPGVGGGREGRVSGLVRSGRLSGVRWGPLVIPCCFADTLGLGPAGWRALGANTPSPLLCCSRARHRSCSVGLVCRGLRVGLLPVTPVCSPSLPPSPPTPWDAVVRQTGQLDCLVRDEKDEYGVIDFKTSSVAKSLDIYARQLHAYAYALECPSDASELLPGRVSHMGLVVYEPISFACDDAAVAAVAAAAAVAEGGGAANGAAAAPSLPAYASPGDTVAADLRGRAVWVPITRDDAAFGAFLGDVLGVLEQPEPPAPVAASWGGKGRLACTYCQYLEDVRAGGLAHSGKLPE